MELHEGCLVVLASGGQDNSKFLSCLVLPVYLGSLHPKTLALCLACEWIEEEEEEQEERLDHDCRFGVPKYGMM